MRKLSIGMLALGAAVALAPNAFADSFSFSVNGSGLSGGGTLITTSLGGGLEAITGGTITLNGLTATIVPDPVLGGLNSFGAGWNYQGTGPSYNFLYDNILPADTAGGILFQLSNGELIEIWSIDGVVYWNGVVDGSWIFSDYADSPFGDPITMDISATPEPGTLLLLGTGLLGLAFVTFRKSRQSGKLTLNW